MTVVFTPLAARFSATSSPMKPPPATTARLISPASTAARRPMASSGVRITNTFFRSRPGSDDQLVIGVLRHLASPEILGLHLMLGGLHRHSLSLGENLCTGELRKLFRGVYDQLTLLVNHVAHVVGQAAAGIGDVLALGQHCHFTAAVLPQQLGRHLGACRHAA